MENKRSSEEHADSLKQPGQPLKEDVTPAITPPSQDSHPHSVVTPPPQASVTMSVQPQKQTSPSKDPLEEQMAKLAIKSTTGSNISDNTTGTSDSASNPQVFGPEAYHIEFEGSSSETNAIRMEPYTGRCQPSADRFPKHVPRLLPVQHPNESYVVDRFYDAFRRQIVLLKQNYDAVKYGELRVVISFGTFYTTNAESEDISISRLVDMLKSQKTQLPQQADARADFGRDSRGRGAQHYGHGARGRGSRGSYQGSRNYNSQYQNKPMGVRSTFIPSGSMNEKKLKEFLKDRNYTLTKEMEEYRPSVKVPFASDSGRFNDRVLILDRDCNFKYLELSDTKWFVFDTVRSRIQNGSGNRPDDMRCKISSRTKTSDVAVLREVDCEDLMLNARRLLVRDGDDVIGVHRNYEKQVKFVRHKRLAVYESQDKKRDEASQTPEETFSRQVKIKVNRGREFTRQRDGEFKRADDRAEVTCTLALPNLQDLYTSEELCKKFVKWIWEFGREFGSVVA